MSEGWAGHKTIEAYIESLAKFPLNEAPLTQQEHLVRTKGDLYSDLGVYPGIYNNYEFQHAMARRVGGKILNAACADDPAQLGLIGAVNLDIQTTENATGHDFSQNKNFVHGTVMDMPFPDDHFDCVVLGEFLEHCTQERAAQALLECRRVLKTGGHLVLTFPLDGRSHEEQRDGATWPEKYDDGISCYHDTWWSDKMLHDLKQKTRLIEVGRAVLIYVLSAPLGGWGLLWQRPS